MRQWFADGRRLCAAGCGHVCDAVGFVSDEFRAREQRLAMARSAGAGARGLLRADDEDDE